MELSISCALLLLVGVFVVEAVDRNCTTRYGSSGWKCGGDGNYRENCIPTWMVCNGSPDCGRRRSVGKQLDNSIDDDEGATCQVQCETDPSRKTQAEFASGDCSRCLSELWWRCKTGTCVRKTQLCDGIRDCSDGSDESSEQCLEPCTPNPNILPHPTHPGGDCRKCPSHKAWKCNDGRCIDKGLLCDGKKDCNRGEDEGEVCQLVPCESDPAVKTSVIFAHGDCRLCFGETRWRCSSGKCISGALLCDGVASCAGGEDESEWVCNSNVTIIRGIQAQPRTAAGGGTSCQAGTAIVLLLLFLLLLEN